MDSFEYKILLLLLVPAVVSIFTAILAAIKERISIDKKISIKINGEDIEIAGSTLRDIERLINKYKEKEK